MSEVFATLPADAFIAALTDPAMTMPNVASGGALLFDPAIYAIMHGNGSAINNTNGTFTLPLSKVYIFVDIPHGAETSYVDDATYRDESIWIPFKVMSSTDADQQEVLRRLDFARKSRAAVFAAHGLTEVSEALRSRRLAYSASEGLVGVLHTWRFWWASSTTA